MSDGGREDSLQSAEREHRLRWTGWKDLERWERFGLRGLRSTTYLLLMIERFTGVWTSRVGEMASRGGCIVIIGRILEKESIACECDRRRTSVDVPGKERSSGRMPVGRRLSLRFLFIFGLSRTMDLC